jgi:hypothetical protein
MRQKDLDSFLGRDNLYKATILKSAINETLMLREQSLKMLYDVNSSNKEKLAAMDHIRSNSIIC